MSVFTNPASSSKGQATAYTQALLELLGDQDPLDVMRETPAQLHRAVADLSAAELRTPEAAGKWSIGQIFRHLADAELVMGWRLRLTLAEKRPTLTGYDQDAWAARLGYAEADPKESLEELTVLRRGTVRLLERAAPDDLERVGLHSERGEESVLHMVRMLAGHDILHLRQVARVRKAVAAGGAGGE